VGDQTRSIVTSEFLGIEINLGWKIFNSKYNTGGYFSGSLAIMTDAAHMLSDFAGFLISLFAIWLGSRPSSNRMSFGWHRAGRETLTCFYRSIVDSILLFAEVVGAVVSVLIIWVITGVLFYEAILRVIHPERFEVNADIMLITACFGVFVNVL
jgi:zinc transporter 2